MYAERLWMNPLYLLTVLELSTPSDTFSQDHNLLPDKLAMQYS